MRKENPKFISAIIDPDAEAETIVEQGIARLQAILCVSRKQAEQLFSYIDGVDELRKIAKAGRLPHIPTIGEKTETKIKRNLNQYLKS